MKNILYIIILICSISLKAQDAQFSQFYATPLYLGPSFAGSAEHPRIFLNFRDQWPQLPGSFITSSLAADYYFEEYNCGAGLIIMEDLAGGLLNKTMIAGQYAYNITVNRFLHFVPGIQTSYFYKNIREDKLQFSDQVVDGSFAPGSIELIDTENSQNFDFDLSLLSYYDNYWLGFSASHLMKLANSLPGYSTYAPFKLSVYGGAKFGLDNRLMSKRDEKSITVAFNYKTQDKIQQLDLGAYLINMPLMVGLWYRGIPVLPNTKSNDAISILTGIRMNSLTFGYSYDLTISKLVATTGGAHEISVVYHFNSEPFIQKKHRAIPCPKF